MAQSSYLSLLRQQSGLLAIGFIALFTGNLGQSFFIGLFQQDIASHLGLSTGGFGTVYALITMCSGFLVMHFGAKLDWISPRRYAAMMLFALLTGVLLMTTSIWLVPALIGLALVRLCGQGLMTHFGSTLIGREFVINRGRALGLVSLGMPLGEIVLPPLIAITSAMLLWYEVWWLIALSLAICWAALFLFVSWPCAPVVVRDEQGRVQRGPNPLSDTLFWQIIPLTMALPVTLTGIFIYQAQMTADLASSITIYALALTIMGMARFPGALMGGRWVDEWGVSLLAKLYLVPFAVAILLAVTLGGHVAVIVLMAGAGISLGMSSPVVDSILVEIWGRENLGRVRSVKSALMVFSTGIAPAILGVLIDNGIRFQSILIGMLTFMLIGWLLALRTINHLQTQPS
ncbi:arabinose efflux permease family protein [Methylophaga frappieri]|uniref:Arabinose efflux permease family protein n=1 Tax=Methylophaga frappieri (strain ATCC BAA-2434 / DSM 25690 / JAM7) TaxID=754477 RepID=I1YFY3_METFJ|nr:MFS transporter [Methylophaga frappieri]AFJ01826.1 arabinose efflux permease family protein [Methylophaga frappieri]